MPGNIASLANVDVLGPLLDQSPAQLHHALAVPDRVGRLLEQVAQSVFAPEVPAAAYHAAREVHREVDPGLVAERVDRLGAVRARAGSIEIHEAFAEGVVEVNGH